MSTGPETNELPHGTKFPHLFSLLSADFDPSEVKLLPKGGRQIKYVTARTVMNRLDDVLGPENWSDEYLPRDKSVVCKLTIILPDGRTVTKADAGGFAGMSDAGDDEKSGFSDAFKRTAAKFGIGRYLYGDGMAQFHDAGGEVIEPPRREPERREPPRQHQQQQQRPASNGNGTGNTPRSGRALFAWTKEMEGKHGVGLLKYLNGWAKLQELPERMVDFDEEQVALAHAEAVRKIRSISQRGEPAEAMSNGHGNHRDAVEDVRANIRREYGGGADDDMAGT